MPYALLLKKQNFKFSSSHFTMFDKTHAEHLHGHNYQVGIKAVFNEVDPATDIAVDFNQIKKSVRALCDQLDEMILIPQKSGFLKINKSPHYAKHVEVKFNDRIYCFPENEVFYIEASNITSESLARYFYEKLEAQMTSDRFIVSVLETAGQAASYTK